MATIVTTLTQGNIIAEVVRYGEYQECEAVTYEVQITTDRKTHLYTIYEHELDDILCVLERARRCIDREWRKIDAEDQVSV